MRLGAPVSLGHRKSVRERAWAVPCGDAKSAHQDVCRDHVVLQLVQDSHGQIMSAFLGGCRILPHTALGLGASATKKRGIPVDTGVGDYRIDSLR